MNNIKREVKNKIKEYSNEKYLDGYIKNEFLTDEGDANIYLKLSSIDELFDKRTHSSQLDLNNKIYKFLDSKSAMLKNDIQINFRIIGLELTQSEKENVKHLFKEHYAIELYKIQKQYRRYKSKIVKLILLGAFFLLSYLFISYNFDLAFASEVFVFLFSFSLWEALDCVIYFFSDLKLQREAITQRLLVDVYFEEK